MTNCPSCLAEVPAGARWCSICRAHTQAVGAGRLASPGKRLGAYFLDGFVWFLVAFFSSVIISGGVANLDATDSVSVDVAQSTAIVYIGLALVLVVSIWSLVLLAKGTSPGKRLVGLRVIRHDGTGPGSFRMLIRETIGKWISMMILGLGFLWVLIDREHQGWHDKLLGTYVVE